MTSKVRVLVIIPTGYVFGLQNAALALFQYLDRQMFCPFFLVSHWNDGDFIKRLEELGFSYEVSYLGFLSKRLQWTAIRMTLDCLMHWPRLILDLWRLMRRHKFDAIYITERFVMVQVFPMLLLWRKPVICHVHDPAPVTRFQRLLQRVLDLAVSRYVAVSDSVRERMVDLGVPDSKIATVYDGIEVSRFDISRPSKDIFRKRFGWSDGIRLVAITGQMIERKGHLDFIEAARLVCQERENVKFLIVGKTGGDYYWRLKRRVDELGLRATVIFCGWQRDAADIFTSIDILVMASRHDEGFGLVVGEAMAAGKPVVITRSGGAVELVADGEEGFVVERSDPAGLANAIMRLLDDPNRARKMGEAGRKKVDETFCIQKQAERFGQALFDVINDPKLVERRFSTQTH